MRSNSQVGPIRSPSSSAAAGVWTMNEAQQARGASSWPVSADTSTILLINADTSIVDNSSYNKPLTISGATISATSKFGAGSIIANSTVDYFTTASSVTDPAFAFNDFTIELWIKYASNGHVMSSAASGTGIIWSFLGTGIGGTDGHLNAWLGGNTIIGTSTSLVNNAWHHIMLTRSGTTTRQFVDGVLDGSTTAYVGAHAGTIRFLSGYHVIAAGSLQDDIRISNVARYTSGFTPPTSGYLS